MSEEISIIDSNSFIESKKKFYSFDIAPGFWTQLISHFKSGKILLLDLVKDEVTKGNKELKTWIDKQGIAALDHRDNSIIIKYSEVLEHIKDNKCYKTSALKEWSENSSADAWLIATAAVKGYTLITFEEPNSGLNSKNPSKKAKIPDVANAFNVKTKNLYYMMRQLGMRLN